MTHHALETLVTSYGYLAVLVGTFLEGETILVVGGLMAHQGYLKLPFVMAAAFAGSLLGDLLAFVIGKWRGRRIILSRSAWRRRSRRIERHLQHHRVLIILFFRFAWGLRNLTPFVLGASRIPFRVFVPLNVAGALIWAVSVAYGGYFFGYALKALLGRMKKYELWIVGGLFAAALLIWLGRIVYNRWRARREADAPPPEEGD